MSKTIASCGHELNKKEELENWSHSWKDFSRDCNPAISHGVLCEACEIEFLKEKRLIKKINYITNKEILF